MATLYLDIDDEITSAAARIRTVDDTRIALVLPSGSRLATSRINFRLLAREAQARHRSLAIVTSEASARALAASAGLPVFGTVAEYEGAGSQGDQASGTLDETRRTGATGTGTAGPATAIAEVIQPGDAAAAAGPGWAPRQRDEEAPAARQAGGPAALPIAPGSTRTTRQRRRRLAWAVLAGLVAFLLVVGGVAGYLLLPSATIVLTPRLQDVQPVSLTVRADPTVNTADPAHDLVPAQRQPFPLQVSDQFTPTGKKIEETKAAGSVHWTNCDPTASYTIPGGSVVRTATGVAFTTDDPVFLPVAILTFPGGQPVITCEGADVGVTAVKPGTDGNVDPGTIVQPPGTYNANVIKVTNPAATTGGTHTETLLVSKADVDGAVATLRKQLDQALTAALQEAVSSGAGATVFPDTKSLSDIVYSPADPTSFVGQQITSFTVGASATGLATAVDESAVEQVAADRISASIAANEELVPGSVTVSIGAGRVDGQAVVFPVTARASQVRRIDAARIRDQVKGLTPEQARQAMAEYGDVRIDLSPGWAATIPTFDFRLDVRVEPLPSAPASASPGAGASPSPATGPAATSPPKASAGGSVAASPVASPS